jgi:two-component system, NarL family, response regulator NreC
MSMRRWCFGRVGGRGAARGHTNRELATSLFISPRTVETHRRTIMHKLRLTTRAEMVAYALSAGMLDPATP